jgi:hypothetical protein
MGLVKVLCQLEKNQCIATLVINSTLCSTANDILDAHANVLPMELLLLKTCHRALIWTHTLPDTHPLHDIICTYHSCHVRKHRTPLHKLLTHFPLTALHRTKTISPPLFLPSHIVPFDSHVESDRDESMVEEHNDDPEIKIFTDSDNTQPGNPHKTLQKSSIWYNTG